MSGETRNGSPRVMAAGSAQALIQTVTSAWGMRLGRSSALTVAHASPPHISGNPPVSAAATRSVAL